MTFTIATNEFRGGGGAERTHRGGAFIGPDGQRRGIGFGQLDAARMRTGGEEGEG